MANIRGPAKREVVDDWWRNLSPNSVNSGVRVCFCKKQPPKNTSNKHGGVKRPVFPSYSFYFRSHPLTRSIAKTNPKAIFVVRALLFWAEINYISLHLITHRCEWFPCLARTPLANGKSCKRCLIVVVVLDVFFFWHQ